MDPFGLLSRLYSGLVDVAYMLILFSDFSIIYFDSSIDAGIAT